MKLNVLYESNDIVVINKPAGLVVHPDGKSEKATLVDLILADYPSLAGVGEPLLVDGKLVDRPGIVHRLDEDTSGVMIITKNQESFLYFKEQFQKRLIQKEYHAFVWGHFKESQGVVDVPIGRNRADFRRWHAGRGVRGEVRDAVTSWQVVHQFTDERGERFSFMHLFPKTGRTHQLRVHMKHLQRPIVADPLYGPIKPNTLGFERVALHARKIIFTDQTGEIITVEAPYPADFEAAIAKYAKA